MVNREVALRRRTLALVLGVKPRDLGGVVGWTPQQVTYLLNGERHLRRDQTERLARLIGRQVRRLFSAEGVRREA